MDGLSIMENQFANQGMEMEFKKKLPDGSFIPARDAEVKALRTKAAIAASAQALKGMTRSQKNEWAKNMKDAGNEMYEEREYGEAMQAYIQALSASSFGQKQAKQEEEKKAKENNTKEEVEDKEEKGKKVVEEEEESEEDEVGNVDDLVIPVLTNLSACCIQISEFGKSVQFCRQALDLRPNCHKARFRLGRSQYELGYFDEAIESLGLVLAATEGVSDADKSRSKIYIDKSERGLAIQKQNMRKRKDGMKKAFFNASSSATTQTSSIDQVSNSDDSDIIKQEIATDADDAVVEGGKEGVDEGGKATSNTNGFFKWGTFLVLIFAILLFRKFSVSIDGKIANNNSRSDQI